MIQRYPLQWPTGWKRTAHSKRRPAYFNRKEKVSTSVGVVNTKTRWLGIGDAVKRVFYELEMLGVAHVQEDVVISTNLRVNMSGLPRGDLGEPLDPGAAVYWELKGKRQCIAVDRYNRVADNLAAVAATLQAMRTIERHGGAEVLERAFLGFAALPQTASRTWREILGIDLANPTFDFVEERFSSLAKVNHPDQGGSTEVMQELNRARADARRELCP